MELLESPCEAVVTKDKVTVREADPVRDRATIVRVLEDNLPEAVAGGRFVWAYLDNPIGIARVWIAESSGVGPIGTSAAFPRLFHVNGELVQALVLSDFAIDRRFRTLGPAMGLLRATLRVVNDSAYRFTLDHPSESMLAVYRRIGGKEIGRRTRYVRLLNVREFARRRWGRGVRAAVLGSVGDFAIGVIDAIRRPPSGMEVASQAAKYGAEFAELAVRLSSRYSVVGGRNETYLNWRFKPGIRFDYHIVTLRSNKRLVAYGVLQQSRDKAMTIVEFVSAGDRAVDHALMVGLVDTARSLRAESLQASAIEGGDWENMLRGHGFSAREQSAGAVVYCGKNEEHRDLLCDIKNWWMTDGDRDG